MLEFSVISLVLLTASVGLSVDARVSPGDWARYSCVLVKSDAKPSVQEITITVGERDKKACWWEMTGKKPDGSMFAIRLLSERVPMVGSNADIGKVQRYLFKDGSRQFLEYKDKSVNGPLLPELDFRTQLLPRQTASTAFDGAFATTGSYLGNAMQLVESGHGALPADIDQPEVLSLDPTLIIGTGRVFRDIDDGRITDRNYHYRPFTAEEYGEMEAAGINFFLTDSAERESWVYERPVFYVKAPVFEDYPNIFYRSNYRGMVMFTDEPAILTNFEGCRRMTDASNLLCLRVAASLNGRTHYSPLMLRSQLENSGVYLGTWDLLQRDIPAWEAAYAAVYHEMQGGVSGVVHEGRYNTETFNTTMKDCFGIDLNIASGEMLNLHYAFLRGAARCFNGAWGTSIYGQSDPKLSPLALKMAYDMGARYIWFWTSDHGHHMPYREQLELTRVLREHEKAHPRRPIKDLLRKPKVAIAFPEGYIGYSEYWPKGMWNNEQFGFRKRNESGVEYGSVVGTALKQGVILTRQGIQFDFIVDGEPARKAGYSRIIRIRTDGSVENGVPASQADAG